MARAKGAMEPMEHDLGAESVVKIPATGEARIEQPRVAETERAAVGGPVLITGGAKQIEQFAATNQMGEEWIGDMMFLEEPVTVMVHESNERFAEQIIGVGNNGINQAFVRGEPVTVKRKFVYSLATAKPTTYSQDADDAASNVESRVNRLQAKSLLKYPFSVIEDKNPKGSEWLKRVLRGVR